MTRLFSFVVVAVSFLLAGNFAAAQPQEGVYYQIKNVNSKKVLALSDSEGDGEQILQRMSGQGERQQWSFVKVGAYYRILNRKTGQALNVRSTAGETPIIASDNGKNLQWSFEKNAEGYVIKSRHSGLVIDVADESTERKASVIQNSAHDGRNQTFELVPVEE